MKMYHRGKRETFYISKISVMCSPPQKKIIYDYINLGLISLKVCA